MTYFFRQTQMAKGWGKEIRDAWDEADHPRGKTTPESTPGSFAPRGGESGGGKALEAPREQSMPGGKYDPNYVNQENWTLSNKQPEAAEMRQHGQKMGQLLRDRADNIPYADQFQQAFLDDMTRMYGKDYAKQLNQRATDEFNDPKLAAQTKALDDKADKILAEGKAPLGPGVKGTSYKVRDKVELGAILSTSWGYDQTNTEFYEVTGTSASGKTVTIRELAKQTVENGFMSGFARPVLGKYRTDEKPMTKKVLGNNRLKIHGNYGYASLWDGTDQSVSWGH